MHQNLAVNLQQFKYGKNSFIVLIPDRTLLIEPLVELTEYNSIFSSIFNRMEMIPKL